ncbi:MAG TPA: MFS transporter, partial [Candidatus Limnocylindrales bacterium]|nr:MFS transporter [Candidatus Limnocylindrales bacterium]
GREEADLDVPDPQVSRRHAIVRPVQHGIVVEDLTSTNGTIVNRQRIDGSVTVTADASIRVGHTELELVVPRLEGDVTVTEHPQLGLVTGRKLRIVSGPDVGYDEIDVDRELVIGRTDADVTILDPELSRRHAAVRPVRGGVEIEDLGATNGTAVNGELIRGSVTVTSDATVQLGETELQLTLERAETAPTRVRERPPQPSMEPSPAGPVLRRTLKVIWGPAAGRTLSVDEGVVIGREGADLTILDPELSRHHALIKPTPDGVVVEDMGSTNGTWVNGERIVEPVVLTSSGKLQLGKSEIEVLIAMPGATRVRTRPTPTSHTSLITGAFGAYATVALQETEAEQVEQEARELTAERSVPSRPTGVVTAPIAPAGRRLGITEENRRWWTLAAMCLGLGMTSLDLTVVNVALPSIGRDLDAGLTALEWVVNAYTLALAVLLVMGGRLGDLYGRRRCFVIGVVVFAVGSIAAGVAPDETVLIISRAVQGIGAAFVIPATLSILSSVFPAEERGRAIGIWAGVSGVALALGPVIGGVLTQYISWRAIFYINGPVAVAAIVIVLLAAPESRDEEAERGIDWPGSVILSGSLFALILALIEAPTWGWTALATLALIIGSAIGLCAFMFVEGRVRTPMLDFGALRAPALIGANVAGFAAFFVMLSMLVYLAVYMQAVLGYDALQSGIRFLPGTGLVAFVAPVAGILMSRILPRYLIGLGMVLVAAAALVVTRVTSGTGYGLLVPAMVLVGFGIGVMMPPMSATAVMAVHRNQAGMA